MIGNKKYFTVTAGRTGTAWLADFLSINLNVDCIHEPLGIFDFGVNMPDIRTMRAFNTFGNCDIVKSFWKRKLEHISKIDIYGETNHTLAKCGLIENIIDFGYSENTTIIILKRSRKKICTSLSVRRDFDNITIQWQWYLSREYPRKIINPNPFLEYGQIGIALWYCLEMEARQAYYKRLYGSKINFIDARLEEIVTPSGAAEFWQKLGFKGDCILPPPKNQNANKPPAELENFVAQLVEATTSFDIDKIAGDYIAQGHSLGALA